MISKKQVFLRTLSLILGLILGIGASVGVWQIKAYFDNPSSSVSKADVEKFSKSDFWEKATLYFEGETKTFLDNYMNIYRCYGLTDIIDRELLPYFEKYGYTTVLSSGLKSDNKLANVYCTEKCLSLYGEELYDNKEILSALKSVSVDKKNITNESDESIYIAHAAQRFDLLKAILSENYSDSTIATNNLKTRMAWICDSLNGTEKIRIYDNGVYYTVDGISLSYGTPVRFVSDDAILIDDISKYIIHLKNSVTLYDIQKLIRDNFNNNNEYIEIYSAKVSEGCIIADFGCIVDTSSSVHIQKYTLSHDLTTQKTQILPGK